MEKINKIFIKNSGYARMMDLRDSGIQTRDIAKAIENGLIEKIKPGLYKLVNYKYDEHESLVEVCHANKRAVICMLSAASFYELTTFNPSEIYVSVSNNTDKCELNYQPIKVYYFADSYYLPGIEILKTKSGIVRIYNKEKTIGDLFRYINKIGENIAFEALKEYLRNRRKMNIPKLLEYASICSVRKKIELLSKAIVGGESI